MEVLKFPHSDLSKPCKEVTVFGPELKVMLEAMWETMKRERGVGLAANQVGILYRMFTMEGPNQEKLFIINPRILDFSKAPSSLKEGCLSAPGELIRLYRPMWVNVCYQDETGKQVIRTFVDVHSVCVQHEMEHLNGISFMQNKNIPKMTRRELAKKWGMKI